ncbi:MAG: hypothetical protein J5527_09280 [Treponema sp.]|nr:hypothetical protein [Treponema sp.]
MSIINEPKETHTLPIASERTHEGFYRFMKKQYEEDLKAVKKAAKQAEKEKRKAEQAEFEAKFPKTTLKTKVDAFLIALIIVAIIGIPMLITIKTGNEIYVKSAVAFLFLAITIFAFSPLWGNVKNWYKQPVFWTYIITIISAYVISII